MSIFHVTYEFPNQELLDYFKTTYSEMADWWAPQDFENDKGLEGTYKGFKVNEKLHHDPLLNRIAKEFCDAYGISASFVTQFIVLEPNTELDWHVDRQPAGCGLNVLLSNDNAPVEFEEGQTYYKAALLNIRKRHRVPSNPNTRIMFRIVFYGDDSSFDEIKEKINEAN